MGQADGPLEQRRAVASTTGRARPGSRARRLSRQGTTCRELGTTGRSWRAQEASGRPLLGVPGWQGGALESGPASGFSEAMKAACIYSAGKPDYPCLVVLYIHLYCHAVRQTHTQAPSFRNVPFFPSSTASHLLAPPSSCQSPICPVLQSASKRLRERLMIEGG